MYEYGRKPYITKNYREMMNTTPNRTVWNQLIEKHSEFEKPYLRDTDYSRMQFFHPIMSGLSPWKFDFDFGGWEFPFDPFDPGTWPWAVSFFCHSNPCYCADETRCVGVGCAYPIIGFTLKGNGCEGLSAEVSGTQICITAGSNPSGNCFIDIIMQVPPNKFGLPEGLQGSHEDILIRECDDCVDCIPDATMAYDYGTSAETIAREDSCTVAITGLNTPFTWSVSGTGFTLDNAITTGLTNTLNADDTACGSATITVTGCDSTVVTGEVRGTTGQWVFKSNTCELEGVGTVWDASYFARFKLRLIKGKQKQETDYFIDYVYPERDARPGTHQEVCVDGSSPCGGWIAQHCAGTATCLSHDIDCPGLHGVFYSYSCSQYDDICRSACKCTWNGSQYEWGMDFTRYEIPTGADLRYYEWEC